MGPKAAARGIVVSVLGAAAVLVLGTLGASWAGADEESAAPAPPGEIRFFGRNLMARPEGTFESWRVTKAEIDRAAPENGFVEVEIDIASVDTGIGRRDAHLRNEDFFEVERWPTATVRVHSAKPDGQGEAGPRYTASFDIRIRDVEKTLPGHFEVLSEDPPRVKGGLTINRVDFGVGKPHSGWNPVSVRNEVPVEFEVELPAAE